METKREKFLRLQDARLSKAIKSIELLENLSGSAYEWSKPDAVKMIRSLNDAVDAISEAYGIETTSKDVFVPIPLNESYVRWSYDKLKAGRTKEGTELLHKALMMLQGEEE